MKRLLKLKILILLLFLFTVIAATSLSVSNENKVLVARIEGVIDPTSASYFEKALKKAESENAILILELDTPGGLDESMRQIIKAILSAKVPIVVFVFPSGARAASAGCFITIASHVAAMAPGTNIGAAHPVGMGGSEPPDKTLQEKITNDAVSYIRGLADKRGRNTDWAEKAVRESASITSKEALRKNVIDIVARDLDDLLSQLNGFSIKLDGEVYTIKTTDSIVNHFPMNWIERLLHALSNPNLAYILLVSGFYGLIYEFANPGIGFSGIGGAICLIMALYSLHILSVNYAGLALILLGLILFIAEAFTPTFGVLAGGGIISFIIGSLLLFESPIPEMRLSLYTIIIVATISMAFVIFIVNLALKAHRKRIITGQEGMIGLTGKANTDLTPEGYVFVRGELWRAVSQQGEIKKGDDVEVTGFEGLTLRVKKVSK